MLDTDSELDVLLADRAVADTAVRAHRWLRKLRRGEGLDDDPFEATRWLSGLSTFRKVSELAESDPLREPLRRWVYRLAELRINRSAICRVAEELRCQTLHVDEPERVELSASELLHRALADAPRRSAWVEAFLGAIPASSSKAVFTLWERRREVAARLGVSDAATVEFPAVGIVEAAERWLTRTDDAFADLRTRDLHRLLETALAAGEEQGWPARLTPQTLYDWFRDTEIFRGLDMDPGDFPPAVAPASFLRALRRLGAAWADAAAPRDQPFVIAHDPYGLRRRTMGALFAALAGNREFSRRRLGVSKLRLVDHQRSVARAALVESRASALRVLLRARTAQGAERFAEAFEELVERAFGVVVPRRAAGVLYRMEVDDAQRLAGLWLAALRDAQLVHDHDEDWFRNPRAIEELRADAARPPSARIEDAEVDAAATAFEQALSERLG